MLETSVRQAPGFTFSGRLRGIRFGARGVWIFLGWLVLLGGTPVPAMECAIVCSDYGYRGLAKLHVCGPFEIDDPCDEDWTMILQKPDGGFFGGLSELALINIPPDRNTPIVIVQRASDKHWLVYDLERETLVAEELDDMRAESIWMEATHAPQKDCYGVGDILPNPLLVPPFEVSHMPDAFPPPLTTRLLESAVIAALYAVLAVFYGVSVVTTAFRTMTIPWLIAAVLTVMSLVLLLGVALFVRRRRAARPRHD